MEAELSRWRRLGHGVSELTAYQNGATLVAKRKTKKQHSPVHHPHDHHTTDASTGHSSGDPIFLQGLMDRIGREQKRDISAIWSGHLNHDTLNQKLVIAQPVITAVRRAGREKSSAEVLAAGRDKTDRNASHKGGPEKPGTHQLAVQEVSHVTAPPNMHDLLEQFDSIKLSGKEMGSAETHAVEFLHQETETASRKTRTDATRVDRQFLPVYQLSVTKTDQYGTLKAVDHHIVESEWTHRSLAQSQQERLLQLQTFIKEELLRAECPPTGPDFRRLEVYRMAFDKLISEFKVFGPVFAEIKHEYDCIINTYFTNQEELSFLRAKVRKLLAQNENRLLLKYERKRTLELERQLESLVLENEELKAELKRKLVLYASYLPPSVLYDKKKEDPLLADISSSIRTYPAGEDPITVYEHQIKALSTETAMQSDEISRLRKSQQEEFVPKPEKDRVEAELIESEAKYEKLRVLSEEQELELKSKQALVTKLEAALREREEQYHFLIAEYTGLQENVNKIK
ncbi:hypothetical protein DFJ73DRAFT_81754 [Zopfochytrium polystomum]|nr:hypothetical protein DFJ73DRAFT_81754 [Zopfochytrium polystomum]